MVYDDLSHSKELVLTFFKALLISLLQCDTKIVLLLFESKYNLKVCCNFFSSRHKNGPADGIAVTSQILAANIVNSRKRVLTDSHSFVKAAESSSIVKVLHVTGTDMKENFSSCGVNVVIKNVVALPGIFSTHHLACVEDETVMHPYTDANYFVKKFVNHGDKSHKDAWDSKSVGVKDIKNGIFVIVPNAFATVNKKQS